MAERPTPLASERERFTTLIFYAVVLLLGYLLLRVFQPFFNPLGWAAVLAICVEPWNEKLVVRHGPGRAAAVTTTAVALLIIGPGLIVLTAFVREATAALGALDRDVLMSQFDWIAATWERVRGYVPGVRWLDPTDRALDLGALVNQASANVAGFLAARVGGLLADLAVFVFHLFVTLFALYFLLRDANAIMRAIRRTLPFDEPRRERMIRQTRDLVYASVTSGLFIASIQGLLGGLLFAALGLHAPVFWGVVMGFFALLPFFGTWVVWLPAAIWLASTGHLVKALTLAAIGAAIIGSVDNVLRPAILAGRARMNGLLMFISLLGGVSMFGLLGLVLGPLVVALAAGLLEAYAGEPEIVEARTLAIEERPRAVP
jgi:predicted PurR-regulated permease PerM